jgi:hypothetical protein
VCRTWQSLVAASAISSHVTTLVLQDAHNKCADAAQRIQEMQDAVSQEVELAVAAATTSAVDIAAVHEAEARADNLEGQVEALLAERELLHQQLVLLEQQVRRGHVPGSACALWHGMQQIRCDVAACCGWCSIVLA